MTILKRLNHLMSVFLLLGLAPFTVKTVHIKSGISSYIPSIPIIISSILNASVFALLLHFGQIQSFKLINSIISMAALLTGLVSNLCSIFQCFLYPVVYRNLIGQIKKIEKNLKENFAEELPASAFANRFRRSMVIILCMAIVRGMSTMFMLLNSFNHSGVLTGVLQSVTSVFSVVVMGHVVLYVDITQMCLAVLNDSIRKSPIFLHSTMKLEFLKYVKLIHMDLWKLTTQINDFFSWSLVNLTISFMINLIYDLYQIFYGLQPGTGIMWALGIVSSVNIARDR